MQASRDEEISQSRDRDRSPGAVLAMGLIAVLVFCYDVFGLPEFPSRVELQRPFDRRSSSMDISGPVAFGDTGAVRLGFVLVLILFFRIVIVGRTFGIGMLQGRMR